MSKFSLFTLDGETKHVFFQDEENLEYRSTHNEWTRVYELDWFDLDLIYEHLENWSEFVTSCSSSTQIDFKIKEVRGFSQTLTKASHLQLAFFKKEGSPLITMKISVSWSGLASEPFDLCFERELPAQKVRSLYEFFSTWFQAWSGSTL